MFVFHQIAFCNESWLKQYNRFLNLLPMKIVAVLCTCCSMTCKSCPPTNILNLRYGRWNTAPATIPLIFIEKIAVIHIHAAAEVSTTFFDGETTPDYDRQSAALAFPPMPRLPLKFWNPAAISGGGFYLFPIDRKRALWSENNTIAVSHFLIIWPPTSHENKKSRWPRWR